MSETASEVIFSIVAQLGKAEIAFSLDVTREDAITIFAVVPGQRWEIDVFKSGEIEIEVFRSGGELVGSSQLGEMIRQFAN